MSIETRRAPRPTIETWPEHGEAGLLGVKAQGLLDLAALGLPTPPALILRAEATTRSENRDAIVARILAFFANGGPGRTVSLRCAAKAQVGKARAEGARPLPESVLDLGIRDGAAGAASRAASRSACAAHAQAFFRFFGRDAPPAFADWPLEEQVRALLDPLLPFLSGLSDPGMSRALIVQRMVYGDLDPCSLTGICYTRHPRTGARMDYGHILTGRRGMALGGVDDPAQRDLSEMAAINPPAYAALKAAFPVLEAHYAAVRQLEFTAEGESLFLLQNTPGNSTLRLPGGP